MAFIPEEEEGSQEPGMNVLSGSDQPQQDSQQQGQNQQVTSGQPTTIGTGGQAAPIGSQVGQAPTPQGNTRKKQGSGMFTDIRKYIKANKQGGQQLAGAVTQDVTQQAQDIRNQIENQQNKFQQSLAQNQANLQQSQDFAQEAVQKAGSGQLSEQDFQRYQNLISGDARFDVAQPIDLLRQRSRAQALQRLSQRAGRAEGREELLKKTFGERPGQRYTRGQRAVDSLLLGADPTASQQLVQGTQQEFGGLAGDITAARKKAIQDVYGLKKDVAEFTGEEGTAAQNILGQEGARTQLGQELDTAAEQKFSEVTNRRNQLLDKLRNRQFLSDGEMAELGVAEKLQGTLQAFLTATKGEPKQVDFAQYLQALDPKTFNRNTIADEGQRARFDALSRLAGRGGLASGSADDVGLKFNAEAAIQDVLSRMGRDDVTVSEEGLMGGDLNALQTAMLAVNPFLAASMFAATDGTAMVEDAASDALSSVGVGQDVQDILQPNLVLNPFNFTDRAIRSGGKVIKTADQLANMFGTKITGQKNVDRVLKGLQTGGLSEATKVASKVANEVKKAANKAKNIVRSIFCFTKDTPIKLSNGSIKLIQDISPGDELYLGGKVNGFGWAIADSPIYEYKGTYVTGSHAVFEDGTWLRVRDSKLATLTDLPHDTIVYPLSVEEHLIVANDFISADFAETDDSWSSTEEERLEELNNDTKRNAWLQEEEWHLSGKKIAN